jgi:hypothetical protein
MSIPARERATAIPSAYFFDKLVLDGQAMLGCRQAQRSATLSLSNEIFLENGMKKIAAACAVLALALAGCASAPQDDGAPAGEKLANNTAGQDNHQMTGSRLKRESTERMLKAVGAQGARDEINAAPRPLQSN